MNMVQYSILILVVGFLLIGFILYLAYKVAEHKDKKAEEKRRVTDNSKWLVFALSLEFVLTLWWAMPKANICN